MYKEFRECLHDEIETMKDMGVSITASTIKYYETTYAQGGCPCPACFIRKNKNVAMQCLSHDGEKNIHADLFECPECEGFIEVGG
ncbi:hypothetical protein [Shewanella surugensis]|uniref:Uncharacterized protein n=1 Tax=Shewanella surugensis TaxID=212020 RepID=A0ABT0L5N3_9GAMM|nr:hypothetical protein [Shewanella surugensis]MCL1122999.1 hypothetical protein [Shewanella surugensis]